MRLSSLKTPAGKRSGRAVSKAGAKVVIVDRQDRPVGLKNYEAIRYEDIYRVTALWLTDSKSGETLIAQRARTKHNDPGKWAFAVAGTIEEGDTYEGNIIQETAEEIGLTGIEFRSGPKEFVDDGAHKFFCQWFTAEVHKDTVQITMQEDEVDAVRWLPVGDLISDCKAHPDKYVPSILPSLKLLGVS